MPASILQANSNAQNPGATSFPVALSGTTAGSTLLIWAFINDGRTITGITDTQGNTWAPIFAVTDGSLQIRVWQAVNIVGGVGANTATVVFDANTATVGLLMAEAGGVKLATPIDGFAGQAQTNPGTGSNAVTSGNATSVSQPALVVAVSARTDGTTAPSRGTGFSDPSAGSATGNAWYANYQYRIEWKRVTATGAQAGTFTASGANDDFITVVSVFDELVATTVNFRKTLSALGGKAGQRQVQF